MKKKMISAVVLLSAAMLAGCSAKTAQPAETQVSTVEETAAEDIAEPEMQSEEPEDVAEEVTTEEATEELTVEQTEESIQANVNETKRKHSDKAVATVPEQNVAEIIEEAPALADLIQNQETVNQAANNDAETSSKKTTTSNKKSSSKKHASSKEDKTSTTDKTDVTVQEQKGEYSLVWHDEFDGDELDTSIWSYEPHQPGWVNNELQEYTTSTDNVYVEDGKLIIQALENVDASGKKTYTSGRINTMNKKDCKYGRFEARLKVPSGQGFLPAFWMMPTQEDLYGQWPKCGEIDIMEVLGNDTDKAYATIHYGEPHTEQQGYKMSTGLDYSEAFHVYACEWEPGEIRFYVDNKLVKTIDDWFTKKTGFDEVAYPAPFDQPFYVILNLAVGGNWPGNPDETTQFGENAQLQVDYVRVYQKDSYDENVQKPVKDVVLREPDATGNYIVNGDFARKELLDDEQGWKFLTAGTGVGSAEIKNNALYVKTTNPGTLDYSIQVVQPDISLEQGCKYKVSFDAYADADRTMICSVTAPDRSYQRYLADTRLNLTKDKKHYSYEFDMTDASDANGRMEFNLGNQPSTATVVITNVRIEKTGNFEIQKPEKSVLPDGNYVYNGTFDRGSNRMDYWSVEKNKVNADIAVTNISNVRELKVNVPETVADEKDVIVEQDKLALQSNKSYVLKFNARNDRENTLKVVVAGKETEVELSKQMKTYTYSFKTDEIDDKPVLQFLLGIGGTTYIDDVSIIEEGMLINSDFSNGLTGYTLFVDGSASATASVDSLTEKNAACIKVNDTGAQDWCIQLKQENVTLKEGKTYKLSFEAKCDMDREMMFAIQKDGSSDNDWTPYTGSNHIELTDSYQTFSKTFTMDYATDKKAILSLSMGTFGNRITDEHTIFIKNISLEETMAIEPDENDDNLIKNSSFSNNADKWEIVKGNADYADVYTEDNKLVFDIKNVGTEDWHVQLKQDKLPLKEGETYQISFYIKSSKGRTVRYAILDPENGYDWYGGDDVTLSAGDTRKVSQEITINKEVKDNANMTFVLSMGNIDGAAASKIEIAGIAIEKIDEAPVALNDELVDETSLVGDVAEADTTETVEDETEEVGDEDAEETAENDEGTIEDEEEQAVDSDEEETTFHEEDETEEDSVEETDDSGDATE